ncbi:MAG TPA: cytochrome c oxidase assembly factor CtaG [Bacillota bacterium]|nr:cytochrome c oxidase assembly factor CtaG [Bacillota bacterium]
MMWLDIQIFGLRALWSPYFITFVIALGVLYFLIVGPWRHKFTNDDIPPAKQQALFYFSLVVLYIVKGSPVDLLAHIMLTAHMIQTALFYFVFPVLFIKGIPVWIWRKVFSVPILKNILNILRLPIISLLMFNAMLAIYHVPTIFDYTKSSLTIHTIAHIILLFAAFIMWWPIVSPIPEHNTMHPLIKMGYLAGSATIITVACALIIFSTQPMYMAYSSDGAWIQAMSLCVPQDVLVGLESTLSGPEMFSRMSTLHDQQLGGVLMQIMQTIVYAFTIGRIFFAWFKRENLKVDPIPEGMESIK